MPSKNTIAHINDDLKFLIACCQTELSNDDINFIFLYLNAEHLELNTLISLANQHGILPLVYKTLKHLSHLELNSDTPVIKMKEGCSDNLNTTRLTLNAEILTELKAHYMSISQRNMLMSAELIRIIRLLEKNNIEALAFKGPILAQMAYGNITLRQYSDLDILVDEKNAFKSGTLMSENGHKAILPLSILSNKTCLHTAKDFSLINESGGVHTELHWQLFEKKYNISILSRTIDKKCQTVTLNNHEIQTLQNEPLLVYLCLHGAKHAFERIEWICDIDRLIRSTELNWKEAISIAERSHSKRSFYLGLSLAYHLFHTTLPSNIVQGIDSDEIRTLHAMTLEQMSKTEKEKSDFQKNRETFFYQLKLFDNKIDMIRFYFSTLFKISTSDCQTFILPEKLKFLYIFLRPIRLVTNYIKRLFHKTPATK